MIVPVEKIILQHQVPDVATELAGLEACLTSFAYVDRFRTGMLDALGQRLPGVPVFFKMVSSGLGDAVRVKLVGPCPDADTLFDRAVTEHAVEGELNRLIQRKRTAWIRGAHESARTKLPLLPKPWHALFEAVPRDKHLPVLCVLLARKKPGETEESHAEWVAEKIEFLLFGD